MNKFPADFTSPVTGFGGDTSHPSNDKAWHRAQITKTPIILVHGNGASATHFKYGMLEMARMLKDRMKYKDAEIWAMDYLGENYNEKPPYMMAELMNPHIKHISQFRKFVDKVREYLGVEKVDFIGHSLGCGMVNAYMRGLQPNGTWNNDDSRIDTVGTFVALAGGTYGLGPNAPTEFQTGSDFEKKSHDFKDTRDDSPRGSANLAEQISPEPDWKQTTALDDDNIVYIAAIAIDDLVDKQHKNTSRREGANKNLRLSLGKDMEGHIKIVNDPDVFDKFSEYLNKYPPKPPVTISIDRPSGNYPSGLRITVHIDPENRSASYQAKSVKKEFQAGFIVETVIHELGGNLSNNESLTLSTDGAWQVVFTSEGARDVACTYGVGIELPEVTIITPTDPPFKGSLDVTAKASRGTMYNGLDGVHWSEGNIVHIDRSATVYFTAIDQTGVASPVVKRTFDPAWNDRVTAKIYEHFVEGRLELQQFLDLGNQLGFTATVTLYKIGEQWVYGPNLEEKTDEPPAVSLSLDTGSYTQPVKVVLSAQDKVDPSPKIYYTLDGSRPTESSLSLISSGSIEFNTSGKKILRIVARNSSDHWSDEITKTYDMDIKIPQPVINCDKPSRKYAEAFEATLSVSDDEDVPLTVYYTEDGTDPSDPNNPSRRTFVQSQTFPVSGNGNHAILVYAKDNSGNEMRKAFAFSIDDQKYPETSIWPSRGGIYASSVEVKLSPSERCQWTKITTDGSDPTEDNGIVYTGPISVRKTTRLKFRSKDRNGNLEPVKTAHFTITQLRDGVFESDQHIGGYIKANPDGTGACVGAFGNLGIGSGWDGKDHRAILHFDTASIPDNADIKHAYLEVTRASSSGDLWADDRAIQIDVQTGYFGTSQAIQADDWNAPAIAMGVAQVDRFTSDSTRSSLFSEAGLKAINKTGVTQIRLRLSSPHGSPNHCLFVRGGAAAKLFVEYEPAATVSP